MGIRAGCDIILYVVDHTHYVGIPDETFILGMQGIELTANAEMADMNAKLFPTDPNVEKSIPTGRIHFEANLNALVLVNMNSGAYMPGNYKSFSEFIRGRDNLVKTPVKFVIEVFKGTSPNYTDREAFRGSGWLSEIKMNASNTKEVATFSAKFHGTAVLKDGNMVGLETIAP